LVGQFTLGKVGLKVKSFGLVHIAHLQSWCCSIKLEKGWAGKIGILIRKVSAQDRLQKSMLRWRYLVSTVGQVLP